MSGPEDFRRQREPVFSVKSGGQPMRTERPCDVEPPSLPALMKIERAVSAAQAAAAWRTGEPTRLEAIAELMLELRWEEFVSMSEGITDGGHVGAASMHAWAKANVRRARDVA